MPDFEAVVFKIQLRWSNCSFFVVKCVIHLLVYLRNSLNAFVSAFKFCCAKTWSFTGMHVLCDQRPREYLAGDKFGLHLFLWPGKVYDWERSCNVMHAMHIWPWLHYWADKVTEVVNLVWKKNDWTIWMCNLLWYWNENEPEMGIWGVEGSWAWHTSLTSYKYERIAWNHGLKRPVSEIQLTCFSVSFCWRKCPTGINRGKQLCCKFGTRCDSVV